MIEKNNHPSIWEMEKEAYLSLPCLFLGNKQTNKHLLRICKHWPILQVNLKFKFTYPHNLTVFFNQQWEVKFSLTSETNMLYKIEQIQKYFRAMLLRVWSVDWCWLMNYFLLISGDKISTEIESVRNGYSNLME